MTKEQYMTQLKKYLHRLPKQDYEDAVETQSITLKNTLAKLMRMVSRN